MRLAYVEMSGFRGYRTPTRVDFADGFTIIDGRNGVGKSTICDAVEFALTGTIEKYLDAKADRESVAHYIWWLGSDPSPSKYVEIGFLGGPANFSVRRDQAGVKWTPSEQALMSSLCEPTASPSEPLSQLCKSTIIRDELIAAFSLDLKEADRYALLRDAIGATDSEFWVDRSNQVLALSKRKREAAELVAKEASREVLAIERRIDELRRETPDDGLIATVSKRLREQIGLTAHQGNLLDTSRQFIAELARSLESYARLESDWDRVAGLHDEVRRLEAEIELVELEVLALEENLASVEVSGTSSSQEISGQVRDLLTLVEVGRRAAVDLDHCPLCSTPMDSEKLLRGIASAEAAAAALNGAAAEAARRELLVSQVRSKQEAAQQRLGALHQSLTRTTREVSVFEATLSNLGFVPNVERRLVLAANAQRTALYSQMRDDVRILQTAGVSVAVAKAEQELSLAEAALVAAEAALGMARRGEQHAKALHDAARRAAGQTLENRLDRVLPLMAELYRRLRPHPIWEDIEYKIRGDVKRFLRLQVGEELNPQFIFSSGQRRATGLAFLLSVNLSLAWSKWQTIMLDDPVQHIDDFRSLHLTELLAQLCASGKQVICVVEDSALGDLLCRRLPINKVGEGKRITLGRDSLGDFSIASEELLYPLADRAMLPTGT